MNFHDSRHIFLNIIVSKHNNELINVTVKENDSLTNFSNLIKKVEEIKASEQKSEPSSHFCRA